MRDGGDKAPSSAGSRLKLRYGRVYFLLRDRFALSSAESLLLDIVDTLSIKTGRCYASRRYLADAVGVSVRSLQRSIGRLEDLRLLERDRRTQHLWPSARWRQAKRALINDNDVAVTRSN